MTLKGENIRLKVFKKEEIKQQELLARSNYIPIKKPIKNSNVHKMNLIQQNKSNLNLYDINKLNQDSDDDEDINREDIECNT
jgi:hypothetical protein